MWPELLDNLRLEASRAESTEERARLRREMGALLSEKLSSYDDALEAYRPGARRGSERHRDRLARVRPRQGARGPARHGRPEFWCRCCAGRSVTPSWWTRSRCVSPSRSEPAERAETLRTIAEVLDEKLGRPGDARGRTLARARRAAGGRGSPRRDRAAGGGIERLESLRRRPVGTRDEHLRPRGRQGALGTARSPQRGALGRPGARRGRVHPRRRASG